MNQKHSIGLQFAICDIRLGKTMQVEDCEMGYCGSKVLGVGQYIV